MEDEFLLHGRAVRSIIDHPHCKKICIGTIIIGLTLVNYFIFIGSKIAPDTQYLFAITIQLVYSVVYPIIMLIIDPSPEKFKTELNRLGKWRALLCGLLWSMNNIFITVAAANLTGFFQIFGIGVSFIGCYILEYFVHNTKYTKIQSFVIVLSVIVIMYLLIKDDDPNKDNISRIYWFMCYTLNQVCANYAQLLMSNAWKESDGDQLYKVAHGNFVTNSMGLIFFALAYPFYISQHNQIDFTYIWIPIVIAICAIIMTFGINILLQIEDLTYAMMSSQIANLLNLVAIAYIPWHSEQMEDKELYAYLIISFLSLVYITQSSDHSDTSENFLQAKNYKNAILLIIIIGVIDFIIAEYSSNFTK